ncbi:hypothetical protein BRARA_J01588 [Brassica rapa]|uniref:MADS-box domain-containing protein n=1 Tax=Brassica campestris TaxID=3711 RepID=A0A397XTY9_BRACM|nr:hypothetical protein BRARA_J01588 [Brassica rapa]
MGRGKIEIKRIENVNNRVVTFSKRRNGLVKKAKEITVLCDAKVALIVFASNGKMTDYCCPSMDLGAMLDQYQKLSGKKLWDAKHEMEYLMTKKRNEKMMVEENRQLSFQLQQQEMEIASNARGMMMRDHDAQFGYRVQPIQPNLQEKIMSLVID